MYVPAGVSQTHGNNVNKTPRFLIFGYFAELIVENINETGKTIEGRFCANGEKPDVKYLT